MEVNNGLRRWCDWLLPGRCAGCAAPITAEAHFCPPCAAELPWAPPGCRRCGLALGAKAAGRLCGSCQQEPPAFDEAVCAFDYSPPIDRLIHDFKYRGQLAIGRALAASLGQRIAERMTSLPDFIAPMPLHRTRLVERGFNQSLELARELHRRFDVEIDAKRARRVRATRPQAELDARQRRSNVRGAFAVVGELTADHVAIVDDVMTSGETAGALARALKRAGVERVSVWVVARANYKK